jgi:hypothetical protein
MTWSELKFSPPARTLRQFAGLWLVFFSGLACLQVARHGVTWLPGVLAALAVVVGPLGLWKPRLVQPIYAGALVLTFPIGWVMSRILLALLYYAVFTPLGVCFRLLGRDALGLRAAPVAGSYWQVKPAPREVSRYFRQF